MVTNIRRIGIAAVLLALGLALAWTGAMGAAEQPPRGQGQRPPGPQLYSIEQAVSDEAQFHTIAFSGQAFLGALTPEQRGLATSTVERQRGALAELVKVRRAISTELRRFLKGVTPDRDMVVALGRRYGELDGQLSYLYASGFARVGQMLTASQTSALAKLRNLDGHASAPAYIYSDPVTGAPAVPSTDHFFFPPNWRRMEARRTC